MADLTTAQQDVYQTLLGLFRTFGLDSLAPKILQFVQEGHSADSISLMLQSTDEYKARFKANDARIKAGMNALNPAEYIDLENRYRQVLSSYGLPKGFYDSQDDFTSWISGDVSPSEIESRVQLAVKASTQADPFYKQALHELGYDQGDMYALFLDRQRALPLLQNALTAADVKSAAISHGLNVDAQRALELGLGGLSRDQANQGYTTIAKVLPEAQRLASIYGGDYTQTDAESEVFQGLASAERKRRQLVDAETANFSGSGGVNKTTLAQETSGRF